MDIHDIREVNYKTVLTQCAQEMRLTIGSDYGVLKRFGEVIGVSPRYLSHVNMGRKKLGDEVCRKIEQAYRLPFGWMDHCHLSDSANPANSAEVGFLAMALKVYRMKPVEVQALLMDFMLTTMNPGEGTPIMQQAIRSVAPVSKSAVPKSAVRKIANGKAKVVAKKALRK